MKKITSLLMSMVMITASLLCCPISVFAGDYSVEYAIIYNPLTENSEDVIIEEAPVYSAYTMNSSNAEIIFENPLEAAEALRDALVNREGVIYVKYYYPDEFDDSEITNITIYNKLFNMSMSEELSKSSVDGDYLKWIWGSCSIRSNNATLSNGKNCCATSYTMTYYTTLEEEQELTEKINTEIPSLKLDEKSDYLKIKAIHDYICESTNYDYVTLKDKTNKYKYTAYGLLVQGYGVCQGYASLFTRLCKENNLEARTITGNNHAWNIVKLGNKFYNVDLTWDDTNFDRPSDPDGNYWSDKYFDYWLLRGSTDFGGHTPINEYAEESFWEPYPLAEAKYVCSCDNLKWVYPEGSSCTTGFERKQICTNCETVFDTEAVPANTQHKLSNEIIANTCTEQGYTKYSCKICPFTYTDNYTDALGHSFTNYISDRNATCTSDGTKTAKCDRCDVTDTVTDTGSVLGHNYSDVVTESTCLKGGYTTHICTRCNDTYVDNYTDALGHSFTNYVSDGNATCTKDGTKTAKCDRCDVENTVTDTGSVLGHNYSDVVTEPTCLKGGYTTHICTRCEDTYIDEYTNALGHNFTNYISDGNATCTSDGTKTAKCDRCDVTKTVTDKGSALGHNYSDVVTEPTCLKGGYTTHICTRCNDTYVDNYTDALGHSFTNYVSDGNATCTKDGTKTAKCDRCDVENTVTDTGSVLGHNYSDVITEPTCLKDGYTTHICTRCNDTYVDNYTDALGHSFTNYVSDGNATCTKDGTKTAKCDRCDVENTVTDTGSVLGHNYSDVITKPTCLKDGYTTHICTRCNDTYVDNYTDELGHSFTNYASDGNATCTLDGTKTAKCDRCDAENTVTDTGSALGHNYSDVVTEPTCMKGGYTTHICTRCNDTYVDNYTDELGHSFTNYASDGNATCTSDGTKTAKCDRCDVENTVTDTGSCLGHSYVAFITVPTCTEQGYTTYSCSVCGDVYMSDYKNPTGHIFNGSKNCVVCGAVNPNYVDPTTTTTPQPTPQPTTTAPVQTITQSAQTTATKPATTVKNPKATSISKLTKGSKQFKVTWKKVTGIDGYQIQYSTNKKFKKNNKTVTVNKSSTSSTIKKLKSKKTYYVRVRTYKTTKVNGKSTKVYSSWSKVKSVKTK